MKKLFSTAAIAAALACLASCTEEKFHIEGQITEAADSLLYFENMSLEGPVMVDSVKLNADGRFSFADKRPEAPEFYRLRIAGQIINLSVDSTETVSVKAQYPTMATEYTVEGSDNCRRIKQLTLMQIELQNKAIALEQTQAMTPQERTDSLEKLIAVYKEKVSREYIAKEPKAASSYFALFQTIGQYLIFNPRNSRQDIKMFAAVATSWDVFYPGALRGANLHNIALEGIKNERIATEQSNKTINPKAIITAGLIDISLTDNKGATRSLTGLKGRVVILDFHVFATKESPARILMLRELYSKYHDRGLEIYQVGFDADEHFWKQQTAALPWISVYDPDGLNSRNLVSYNVRSLPEFFIIDRGNNLVSRSSQVEDLEKAIEQLL